MSQIKSATPDTIHDAADRLKAGSLVAFPTETVYGLGANALDGKAVASIFAAKDRPRFNPLIIHVPGTKQAELYAVLDKRTHALARAFWPGPLTMVLPRKKDSGLSDLACAGLDTAALRVPNHPVALGLLSAAGIPLAAPSANKSEGLSPTSPVHVAKSLGNAVPLILADGRCSVGLESTILDLSTDTPVILRPGAISAEDIQHVLGIKIPYRHDGHTTSPKAPGRTLRHYAPRIPLRMNAVDLMPGEALLGFGSLRFMGIKGGGAALNLPEPMRLNLSETKDLYEAAANLFAMLDALDKPDHTGIAVMAIPDQGLGIAINDRLKRASQT